MAEILVHNKVEISDIDHFITWDLSVAKVVSNLLKKRGIKGKSVKHHTEYNFKHHYFSDLNEPLESRVSLTTAPKILHKRYKESIREVKSSNSGSFTFDSIEQAVGAIHEDFHCIKELKEIDGLESENPVHTEDVGSHSRSVVGLIRASDEFDTYSEKNQNILILAAYLHDIGKGPASRWSGGKQKTDHNHPLKSLPMLTRILTEEIDGLDDKTIRRVFMLVTYDDLIGDIVANGRDKKQLFEIIKKKTDVDLLITLGKADMGSIKASWVTDNLEAIEVLRQEAYSYLESRD
ncbi:HD domain-containing protein [Amphritea japonica]|nr:HD domain-containing protein [Amphritea japonica]